jgi:hypothetical protein
MTRNDIRKKAKALGYKVKFKTNPLSDKLISLGFVDPDSGTSTNSANVFHADYRNKHKAIFDYLCTLHHTVLDDTRQKICVG